MQLNNMQYSRAFAFFELLKMTLPQEGKTPRDGFDGDGLPKLNESAISEIQKGTVENASIFAQQNFPDVSFPDETERETAPAVEVENPEFANIDREPTSEELTAF